LPDRGIFLHTQIGFKWIACGWLTVKRQREAMVWFACGSLAAAVSIESYGQETANYQTSGKG
jgi:hypothetical protein